MADILEQCLERIERGATVDECLAAHPAAQAELELPLRTVAQLRALPRPPLPAPTRAALETKMLRLAAERRAVQAPHHAPANGAARPVPPARRPLRGIDPAAALAGLLGALGFRGTLYQPRLRLAAVAVTIVLAVVLSAGALAAARAVIGIVHPQPTSAPTAAPLVFDGPIEQISEERWVVGGQAVLLNSQTTIRGNAIPGMTAHVHGTLIADGALLADSIVVEVPPATFAPSAVPTATLAPTALPTTTSTAIVSPTVMPTPSADQPQPAAPPTASNDSGGNNHTCRGQQRGRDDKKCDPKPHDNKPPGDKHDYTRKDGKGRGR